MADPTPPQPEILRVPVDPGMWAIYEITWNETVGIALLAARQAHALAIPMQELQWELAAVAQSPATPKSLEVTPSFEYALPGTAVTDISEETETITITANDATSINNHEPLSELLAEKKIDDQSLWVVDQRAVGSNWKDWTNDGTWSSYAFFQICIGNNEWLIVGIDVDSTSSVEVKDLIVLFPQNSRYTMFFGDLGNKLFPAAAAAPVSVELSRVLQPQIQGDYKVYQYSKEEPPAPPSP